MVFVLMVIGVSVSTMLAQGQPNQIIRELMQGQNGVVNGDSVDYFPLEVGNSYSYEFVSRCHPDSITYHGYPYRSHRITQSCIINGTPYSVFDSYFLTPDTMRRDEAGNIVMYNWGVEQPFYKTNIQVGESWGFNLRLTHGPNYGFVGTLVARDDTMTVPAGHFTRCLKYYFKMQNSTLEFTDWLAPDVGLVYRCIDESYRLERAQIRGRVYPGTNAVDEGSIHPMVPAISMEVYPNPTLENSSVAVRVVASTIHHAEIFICDVLGNTIANVFTGDLVPGTNQYQWNYLTNYGRRVNRGTYFICVAVKGHVWSKEIVVSW
ncbi:MAG: hypothetical protein IPP94_17785 [Ignavibacteria bacterium]|nr:hypothetical protein [Ignavibacteria bacterium]